MSPPPGAVTSTPHIDESRRGEPWSGPHVESRRIQERRIAYFMLFRLAMLAAFTVLAAVVYYARDTRLETIHAALLWSTLVAGYGLTIVWARLLPKAKDLPRFASIQTATDIILSAIVVQMTGGVDSGFVTLYLISVLGAATMGGPRQTWAAAGACLVIVLTMSSLEYLGVVVPGMGEELAPLSPRDHWLATGRTAAGLVGVSVLSSYLNTQLATSVVQVGKLRALNENIVRSLSSGLLTVDLDGRVLYFNPMARTILEMGDDQIGQPVEAILPGLGKELEQDTDRHELDYVSPDGTVRRIGLSRSPLVDADSKRLGLVINFQDLSAMHDLQQRVRRNERLAALGGLAASVAHEIRNPLAAISGSSELLDAADLADEDARLLEIIRRESTRLSGLITDLLAFTRPRPPQQRTVDIGRAVEETADAFRADPAAEHVEVRTRLPDSGAATASVDPAQLSQVLWNLLRNAAEARADGAQTNIEVGVDCDDDAVTIVVSDDGPGIVSENLDSIFDPFFTTKEGGTGFGLAIVHRIVEDNEGTITARSGLTGGATFTITFPRPKTRAEDSGVLEL